MAKTAANPKQTECNQTPNARAHRATQSSSPTGNVKRANEGQRERKVFGDSSVRHFLGLQTKTFKKRKLKSNLMKII
jgi:hypothetical protein